MSREKEAASGMTPFNNPLDSGSVDEEQPGQAEGWNPTVSSDFTGSSVLDLDEETDEAMGVKDLAKMGAGMGKLGLGLGRGAAQLGGAAALGSLQKAAQMTHLNAGSPKAGSLTTEELKALFDEIDVDGGGTLDQLEVRQLINGLGVQLTDSDLEKAMQELASGGREADVTDLDSSEVEVSFEQFHDWWVNQMQNVNTIGGATSNLARLLMGVDDDEDLKGQAMVVRATWLDPSKPFKRTWDSYIIVILLYIGITLPYRLAFESTPTGNYYTIAVLYEMSLLVDVALNFRTAFYDAENAEMITDTMPMIKNYLIKRVGWMDIISSIPFQTLQLDSNPNVSNNLKTLQILRLCQVARIMKVIRAIKALQDMFFKLVNDTFGSLSVSISVYTMRMTKLVTLLVTVAHLCACGWYIVGKPNSDMVDSLDLIDLGLDSMDDDGWVMRLYPQYKDDKLRLYLHAFYFVQTTMSTVGYGDIGPIRTGEVIFAMFVQFLGCAIFGYVVGLMGTDVNGLDAHEGPLNVKVDFMEALMDKHKFNKDVRHRVRRQYQGNLKTAQLFLVDEVLADLPSQLKRDVTLSVYRRPVTTFEGLAGFPPDYTSEIVQLMMPYYTIRGDTIYALGTPAEEIYFVDEGELNIEWHDARIPRKKRTQHVIATVEEGRACGDEGLMESGASAPLYVFTATSKVASTLFYIQRTPALAVMDQYTKVGQAARNMCMQKLNRWQAMTENTLKQSGESEEGGTPSEANAMFEYVPRGKLPLPVFSQGGRLVPDESEASLDENSSVAEGEDSLKAVRADVRRLEGKLDKLLTAIESRR